MALSVIRLESIRDSFELNFDLPSKQQWQVICPSPVIADATRKRLSYQSLNVECLTISKFLGDFYSELQSEQEVTRKSQLLRVLATIWKLKFSDKPTFYFEQAFELFTDLRSFTLNPQLVESVLSHYDPVVADAVRYFWLIVEGQEIVDEHLAYHLILEGLEQGDIDGDAALKDKGLIFQGFTHLSGSQIDLLKMLGRFTEVIIPIPLEVINESIKTDWVDWISTQADTVKDLSRVNETSQDCAEVVEYEKLSQNDTLANIMGLKSCDLLLVKNNISFRDILSMSKRDYFFKTELDFFKGISRDYIYRIERKFLLQGSVESGELIEFINEQLLEVLKKDRNFQTFSEVKFIKMLIVEIEEWCQLSDSNDVIDKFSIKIIWEILTLNLPRNYSIPLLETEAAKIMTLKELPEVTADQKIVIIVDEAHDLKGGSTSSYSKDVSEILYTLGPVRRKGLDILFYKAQLKEVLLSNNATLMIEKGLIEHDKLWNNIVKELLTLSETVIKTYPIEDKKIVVEKRGFSFIDHISPERISASRLQMYLDCPRKYYYSYILKLGKEPPRQASVDPRLLGNFEHEIVQQYLSENREWNNEIFNKLVDEIVTLPREQQHSVTLYEETLAEVKFYSKVMIEELLKLILVDPECIFVFESPMKGEGALGFADIYITSKVFGRMLFDLKRSSGSVPLKNEVLKLTSIQLWYYMEFLEEKREYFDIYGFLNFSDPSSSLVFYNNNDSAEALQKQSFLNIEKMHPTFEEFDERQSEFLDIYTEAKEKIINTKDFPIRPRSSSVCHFCSGNVICSREVDNVEA